MRHRPIPHGHLTDGRWGTGEPKGCGGLSNQGCWSLKLHKANRELDLTQHRKLTSLPRRPPWGRQGNPWDMSLCLASVQHCVLMVFVSWSKPLICMSLSLCILSHKRSHPNCFFCLEILNHFYFFVLQCDF